MKDNDRQIPNPVGPQTPKASNARCTCESPPTDSPDVEEDEDEIYRIACNTMDTSVDDIYAMATPKRKRPPVQRIPTSTKKTRGFAMLTGEPVQVPETPLSESPRTLPSLPSISQMLNRSEESMLDMALDLQSTPKSKTAEEHRIHEVPSMAIEDILLQSASSNVNLLDVELSMAVSSDGLVRFM
ncbi:hypothetical protein AX17_003225 [Amanita inopinata Kibby_2008]|nr:hypothetical protein AX17_003225 [Amanita inopinata Kibby_2008]